MTTKKLSRREKLELSIAQKQEQLKRLSAQERTKERKRDTRKKIVAGAIVLQHATTDSQFKATIDGLINKHVTSENDRELFGLDPLNTFNQKGAE
ncbi:hypothetical protein ACVBEJ_09415 [Porticoccus sp. GXU_MW_L64]